jgi:hypothetical protein
MALRVAESVMFGKGCYFPWFGDAVIKGALIDYEKRRKSG